MTDNNFDVSGPHSTSDSWTNFCAPMAKSCRAPVGVDAREALRWYASELERFTANQLRLAWAKLAPAHVGRFWPPLADCIAACAAMPRDAGYRSSESLVSYAFRRGIEIADNWLQNNAQLVETARAEALRDEKTIRDRKVLPAEAKTSCRVPRTLVRPRAFPQAAETTNPRRAS